MSVQQCKEAVEPKLSQARWIHSLNVSKEAVKLAKKYGADPQKAEIAGLLHDIMKDTDPEEQLQILQQFGIILTNIELAAPKLWHAMSGAAYLAHCLGETDPDILNAVRYHTTARKGMSLLEKVIYIADFTSAERDYEGVEQMRKAAGQSLEKAMEEGLIFTIQDLSGRKLPVHPDTLDAYNDWIIQKKEK
ncbi:MAG: HD domain-containing protein [Clostridiales bacterium]|nr:HD domain-containing protein [Clostridiales bacterium]